MDRLKWYMGLWQGLLSWTEVSIAFHSSIRVFEQWNSSGFVNLSKIRRKWSLHESVQSSSCLSWATFELIEKSIKYQ